MSEVEPPKAEVRKTLTNMPAMETPQSVTHQMMSEDEITRRISKAEEEAKRDYNGYRRKVLAFALVGYIYILFVPMVLVLLMAGSAWFIMQTGHLYGFEIQIVLGLLIALFAYLRALWVPLAPPTGLKLERSDYPELFNLVSELSKQLKIKVDHILVDDQFNAMVVQHPRLGFFGWYENYVVLGLPLMQSLPPQHFMSVLVHEFGHISGNHGKSTAFIYNQRVRLVQLLIAMHQHSQLALVLLSRFYDWYYPRFSSASLVIAREHEKQADLQAIEVTDGSTCGEALSLTEVKGNLLNEVWESIHDSIKENDTPPDLVYFKIGEKLCTAPENKDKSIEKLAEALRRATDSEDSHPSLSERLKLANFSAQRMEAETLYKSLPLEFAPDESAAGVFFGKKLPSIIQYCSDQWFNTNNIQWKSVHLQIQEAANELRELEQKAETQKLSLEELLKVAQLTAVKDGPQSSLPNFEKVLEVAPKNAEARYAVAMILLEREDESGALILKELAEEKQEFGLHACASLRDYYEKKRNHEAFKDLEKLWFEYQSIIALAQQERQRITKSDVIGPHNLSKGTVETIVEILKKHDCIVEAYLYCKLMQYLPDQKFYVLVLVPKNLNIMMKPAYHDLQEKLKLEIQFPGTYTLDLIASDMMWMKDNAATLPNALIYKRQD